MIPLSTPKLLNDTGVLRGEDWCTTEAKAGFPRRKWNPVTTYDPARRRFAFAIRIGRWLAFRKENARVISFAEGLS